MKVKSQPRKLPSSSGKIIEKYKIKLKHYPTMPKYMLKQVKREAGSSALKTSLN